MADVGAALGDFGTAVEDIFGAAGSEAASSEYTKAANIAASNARIAQASGAISVYQQTVQAKLTTGAQAAETAGAGFNTAEGSAGDLARSSASQAALAKATTQEQAEITQQGYEYQAEAYKGQAATAALQAKGQAGGGLFGALGGVGKLFGLF